MIAAYLIAASAIAAGSFWAGLEWQQGRHAIALQAAIADRDKAQDAANNIALAHASNTAVLSRKLGDARVQLRDLTTGRNCLSADAVGVLNAIGPAVPPTASAPAGTPATAATDRDVGDALAICRGEYDKLAGQVNAILDIEDMRQRPGGGVAALRAARPVTQPPLAVRPE